MKTRTEQLFRDQIVKRISSPEQLNDYVRVSNPSVWIILASIFVLLTGIVIWSIFGQLNTTVKVVVFSDSGSAHCYVKEKDASSIEPGQIVKIGQSELRVAEKSSIPIEVNQSFEPYTMHVGDLKPGEWVYEVLLVGTVPPGTHSANIITKSVAPMHFLWN